MDSTKNSSFAPLDYYKRLTDCLANRKQLRVNLGTIPGIKDYKKKPKQVMLTNEKIQAKVMAKYSESKIQKLQKQNSQQQPESSQNHQSKNNDGNSKVIKNGEGSLEKEKIKRKKDESFLNLSPTFFKAEYKGPELSIFKVPDIPLPPPPKKPKIDKTAKNRKPTNSVTTEFTIASLFSGNFNPRKVSTPNDKVAAIEKIEKFESQQLNTILKNDEHKFQQEQKQKSLLNQEDVVTILELDYGESQLAPTQTKLFLPKPFISDPNEILKEIEASMNFEREILEKKSSRTQKNQKIFDDLVMQAADKWDKMSFSGLANPVKTIQKRLLAIHDRAIQSPRPSMLSEGISTPKTTIDGSQSVFKIPNLPKPVFYENKNEEKYFNDIDETVISMKNFNIDETPILFNSPAFSLSTTRYENNFLVQNDHTKFPKKSNFDETATLFGRKNENIDFERFNFNLCDSSVKQKTVYVPSTSNTGIQKDHLLDSFFESPSHFYCDNDEMSWIDRSFESILNPDKHLPQPQQQFSPNAFSVFKSPPNSINSGLSLQQKFAKAINRHEQEQTNSRISTFFEGNQVSRITENKWINIHNYGANESLPNDSTNYNLFNYKFF